MPSVGDLTGGPLSILHLAMSATRMNINVRIISVGTIGVPIELIVNKSASKGLENFESVVEIINNGYAQPISFNPNDMLMATLYYTAHIATTTAQLLNNKNIIYFIQDYEPLFFPHGSDWLEAIQAYKVPHYAIFSTLPLQQYFERTSLGIFGRKSVQPYVSRLFHTISPAIRSQIGTVTLTSNRVHRFVTYARPHIPRNAYELTIGALSEAIRSKVFGRAEDWEFIGLGANEDFTICESMNPNICLNVIKHSSEQEYYNILAQSDVGLSLMISPHPSLPPLDFAASGVIVVTNSFWTKTSRYMTAISPNIITVEPSIDDIVEGLRKAVDQSYNFEGRKANSIINWPTDWADNRCFGPDLFSRIKYWFTLQDRLGE